jgi:uncharacterized phiE125 gp8 family phage protein
MSDLTTIKAVKGYLGQTNPADDYILRDLITRESKNIKNWLNRDILSQTYTKTYNGTGGTVLVLSDYPVTAVSGVWINGNVIPLAPDFSSAGYMFDDFKIVLRGYVFTKGLMNVKVAYAAGYSEVPDDIEQACIELVALSYRERDRVGLASKAIAGETTSFIIKDMPESVKGILNQYKKVMPT